MARHVAGWRAIPGRDWAATARWAKANADDCRRNGPFEGQTPELWDANATEWRRNAVLLRMSARGTRRAEMSTTRIRSHGCAKRAPRSRRVRTPRRARSPGRPADDPPEPDDVARLAVGGRA